MVNIHSLTAKKLIEIREELKLILLKIHAENIDFESGAEKYKQTIIKLNDIYKESPRTSDKAVKQAKKALNISKDNEFNDKEIDLSLPKLLRKEKIR